MLRIGNRITRFSSVVLEGCLIGCIVEGCIGGVSHRLYWSACHGVLRIGNRTTRSSSVGGVSHRLYWRAVLEGCHTDWQCSGGSHRLYWRAVSSAVLECLPWRRLLYRMRTATDCPSTVWRGYHRYDHACFCSDTTTNTTTRDWNMPLTQKRFTSKICWHQMMAADAAASEHLHK